MFREKKILTINLPLLYVEWDLFLEGKSITRAIARGLAIKIETYRGDFFGPLNGHKRQKACLVKCVMYATG